jgi:hypothetical protein
MKINVCLRIPRYQNRLQIMKHYKKISKYSIICHFTGKVCCTIKAEVFIITMFSYTCITYSHNTVIKMKRFAFLFSFCHWTSTRFWQEFLNLYSIIFWETIHKMREIVATHFISPFDKVMPSVSTYETHDISHILVIFSGKLGNIKYV